MLKSVFLSFCALSLCLLILPDRLSAQRFQPSLKGTEMLIEADGKQDGALRRGIWAYEPETGKLRLLIENAQRPIWNPQHTHFAFRRAETFCVSDLRGKRYEPLDSLCGGDLIGWHPDGKRLFFWNPLDSSLRPVQTDKRAEGWIGFTVGVWEARLDKRKGLITGAFLQTDKGFRGYHVGKVRFSPDGRKVALEVYRAVPLVGRLESKIAIAEVSGKGEVGPLRQLTRLPDRFYELNPVWSPDGQHIALDVVDARQQACVPCIVTPDGETVGFLIDASGQEMLGNMEPQNPVKRLPSLPDDHAQQPWRVLDWVSNDRLAIVTSELMLTRDAHMTVDRVLIYTRRNLWSPPVRLGLTGWYTAYCSSHLTEASWFCLPLQAVSSIFSRLKSSTYPLRYRRRIARDVEPGLSGASGLRGYPRWNVSTGLAGEVLCRSYEYSGSPIALMVQHRGKGGEHP